MVILICFNHPGFFRCVIRSLMLPLLSLMSIIFNGITYFYYKLCLLKTLWKIHNTFIVFYFFIFTFLCLAFFFVCFPVVLIYVCMESTRWNMGNEGCCLDIIESLRNVLIITYINKIGRLKRYMLEYGRWAVLYGNSMQNV